MYAAPSVAGVNIGGSVRMEFPVFDRLNINESISGQAGGIGPILGLPYAVFSKLAKAVDAAKTGEAVESRGGP